MVEDLAGACIYDTRRVEWVRTASDSSQGNLPDKLRLSRAVLGPRNVAKPHNKHIFLTPISKSYTLGGYRRTHAFTRTCTS